MLSQIHGLFKVGKSPTEIARRLNDAGIQTKHGKAWYPQTVISILRRMGITVGKQPPEILYRIVRMRVAGIKSQNVAEILNADKEYTPMGCLWTRTNVDKFVSRYGGKTLHNNVAR